jgi:FkbM family methyltransferase
MDLANFIPNDRPTTILDAGANIGAAAVLFAHTIGLYGEVITVEANPDTYTVMAKNVKALDIVVKPVQRAITTHADALTGKQVVFRTDGNFAGDHIDHEAQGLGPQPSGASHMSVSTISLPQLRVRFCCELIAHDPHCVRRGLRTHIT